MQTKREFEEAYAKGSGMSLAQLQAFGLYAEPCDCNEGGCGGWKMVCSVVRDPKSPHSEEKRERMSYPALEAEEYKARYMLLASGEPTERLERVAKVAKSLVDSALVMARTTRYPLCECIESIDCALHAALWNAVEPRTRTGTKPGNRKGNGMLVLSRKVNEKLVIGDDITIMVVDIDRGKVRLGITAPKNVSVHRQEIKKLIDEKECSDD